MMTESGAIKNLIESHNYAVQVAREKNHNPTWEPDADVLKVPFAIILSMELSKSEEFVDKFSEFAHELAMEAVVNELVKIVMEGK